MSQSISELLSTIGVEGQQVSQAIGDWLEAALSEQGSIPKGRFDEVIAQRNKLRAETQELAAELEALRNRCSQPDDEELETLRAANEALTERLAALMADQWAPYAAWFQPGHPNHHRAQRIADDFHLPARSETLTLEQVEHNLAAIKPYLKADYFASTMPVDSTPPAGRAPANPSADLRRIFSTFGG